MRPLAFVQAQVGAAGLAPPELLLEPEEERTMQRAPAWSIEDAAFPPVLALK